jgi:hypothetical protein
METEPQLISKNEKPPVLFHVTRNPEIEIFEPRAERIRDRNEGPKIFATPSRALVGVFLVECDDSWVQLGMTDDVPYIIISDEERFRSSDKGGTIYSLPNDTFENDPEKGLREFEWTSGEPLKPIGQENIPSALGDMLAHGVKIFFVDKETFRHIQDSSDDGESIIKNLAQYNGQ